MAADRIVWIDDFGTVVEQGMPEAKYEVVLSGGYRYNWFTKKYEHDVKSVKPKIPLTRIYHEKILVE